MTTLSSTPPAPRLATEEAEDRIDEALGKIRSALRGLRYGTVSAVVQDGVVVQVERTEKVRLDRRDHRR